MSATQINMYVNPSHTAKYLCICQQFAEYSSRDNPACCLQSVSREAAVVASLLYYQNKAQPAPGHIKPHSEKMCREEFPGISLFSLLPDMVPDDASGEGSTNTWRVRLISSTPSADTGVVDGLLPGTSWHQHLPTRSLQNPGMSPAGSGSSPAPGPHMADESAGWELRSLGAPSLDTARDIPDAPPTSTISTHKGRGAPR